MKFAQRLFNSKPPVSRVKSDVTCVKRVLLTSSRAAFIVVEGGAEISTTSPDRGISGGRVHMDETSDRYCGWCSGSVSPHSTRISGHRESIGIVDAICSNGLCSMRQGKHESL